MKCLVRLTAACLIASLTAACASGGNGTAMSGDVDANFAHFFQSGPAPCPSDANDLAGIEGWAPGAGKAEEGAQTEHAAMGGLGGALGGGSQPTPSPTGSTCKGISPDLAAYYDKIDATAAAMSKDGYNAAARAAELTTPDAAFSFVRDSIATEAYMGAMRGADGTLAARGGSPADKALLLAALLSAQQVPVRFAHTILAPADAQSIVKATLAASPKAADTDSGIIAKLGLDQSEVATFASEQRARVTQMADDGIASADIATTALLASAPAAKLATDDATLLQTWVTNVSDHWWLQAQVNGAWTDYDPTLPNATAGTHLGPVSAEAPVDALPDTQYVGVTLALTGDFSDGNTLQTKTLATATATTASLAQSSFAIILGDRSKGASNLEQGTSFTPEIRLGDNDVSGDAFSADGSGSRMAVLRLNIAVHTPGAVDRTMTRTLVDRRTGGTAAIDSSWTPARTAVALTGTYNGLVVSGELNRDFTVARDADSAKLARAFTEYAAAGGNGTQLPPPGIAEPYPYETMHYFLYDSIARMRLEDRSKGAVRFFFDRPQIAMVHRGFTTLGSSHVGVLQFDIADNGMAAAGNDPSAAIHANAVRGYIDTRIERHIFGFEPDFNTIAVFEAAQKAGVATTVTAQNGTVRIAPASSVSIDNQQASGWFEVDPQSGNLIGRMQGGAGQAMVEYAIDRINDFSSLVAIMQFYGDFFRCIAMGVEAPLMGSQSKAQQWFENCALGALCNFAEAMLVSEAFSRCDECSNIEALIYNIMDYGTYGKSSTPGSLGYACGKLFPSPF